MRTVADFAKRSRRWLWPLAGLLAGLADAYLLRAVGFGFTIHDRDATLLVGAYFGLSFAALAWLGTLILSARDRERRHHELLQAQAVALDAARQRLHEIEKLAALGQLSAAVAHEVRNPLGVIRSAAQSLSEVGNSEAQRAAGFIISEADRLNGVVSSVLAFARPLQVRRRRSTVAELLERALLLAREEASAKQIKLRNAVDGSLPPLEVDPDLVTQALFTLLHNAVEAVGPGGVIDVGARCDAGLLRIDVADSGPGIPMELRSRIFEPFFTTRPQGTGLGLAIVRQIVEAHRGALVVDSSNSGGARFTLSLPLAA